MTAPGGKSSPRATSAHYQTSSCESGEHGLAYAEHEPRRLRAQLARALDEPKPVPTLPPSKRAQCEERAAHAYTAATNVLPDWSEYRYAREIDRCRRMHRDYRSGHRALPADVVLALPEQCQIVFLADFARGLTRSSKGMLVRELIRQIEAPEDEEIDSARVA